MIRASVIGLAVSAILAATVASMAGCDGSDDGDDVTSAETIKSANVSLTIQDENGSAIGGGSGILIAPKLVLTAAHLVSGQSKWKITAADGSTRTGIRGLTYDWLVYDSDKAHPRRHDVAVIYLDKPISLGAYPHLANGLVDGTGKTTRLNAGAPLPAALSSIATFPHAFITDLQPGEHLDTGGAVLDERNHIIGVVTGRGLTTGKLYIARTDQVGSWVSSQTHNCNSGSSSSSSSGAPPADDGLHVHTYQPPPESSSGTTSSGSTSSTSSSGTTSSGSTSSGSTSSTSSSGATSSGSTSTSSSGTTSSGDVPPGCQDQGDGHCYGGTCDNSSSSSSSSSGSTSSSSGSTSSGSTSSGSTSGSSGPGSIPPPSTSSGQTSTGSSGATSSGSTHGTPPGGDACQGPTDNPEACPPEPDGCQGAGCGGGTPDDRLDYGGCACGGNPPSGDPHVK